MVFYDYFFSVSFLSMFLVPWHFLPRTIFILDWLEQASCAYICTVSYYFAMLYILVDCVSSLEYPLISYGDFIVLFVIIIHVIYVYIFMYVFKGLICSVHKSGYSISFNGVFGDDRLMYYSHHLLVNHHFRFSYEALHVSNLTTYI